MKSFWLKGTGSAFIKLEQAVEGAEKSVPDVHGGDGPSPPTNHTR